MYKEELKIIISNPLEQFEIYGIWVGLTNENIYMLKILIIMIYIISMIGIKEGGERIGTRKIYIIIEIINNMIKEMVESNINRKEYISIIKGLFYMILISNLIGLVPYSFTITSQFIIGIGLSILIIIGVTIIGIKEHSIKFIGLLIPNGTPLILAPMLTLIELLSYIARSISLGLRLSANMFAGHTLLKIISMFSWKLYKSMWIIGPILTIIPIILIICLLILELGIAFLQSYVFVILTCFYIKDGIHLH